MGPKDTEIWTRFIVAYPDYFEGCDYDVICGNVELKETELAEEWKRNAQYLGSWKIDVLGFKGEKIYIVECRVGGDIRAIGTVLCECRMFKKDHPELPEPVPMIITDYERPNMKELCAEMDILYFVV